MKISPLLLATALLPLVNAQLQALEANPKDKDDFFGTSVDVDFKGTMVVGAPAKVVGAPGALPMVAVASGAAYIYAAGGAVGGVRVTAGIVGDGFGYSVAVDENTIVVGSPFSNAGGIGGGSAYIFGIGGGPPVETLNAVALGGPLNAENDQFGISVAVDTGPRLDADWKGTIVIGAHKTTTPNNSGSAYVWERAKAGNWIFKAKLVALTARFGDEFGRSVAVCGLTIVIGAPKDDHAAGNDRGSAYVFERNKAGKWIQAEDILKAPAAGNDDRFGFSVAIGGIGMGVGVLRTIVVGAPKHDNPNADDNIGSAFVFSNKDTRGGRWTGPKTLAANNPAKDDFFGFSVSIQGNSIVVGAPFDDAAGIINRGRAYLFERTDKVPWRQVDQLQDDGGKANDLFGRSVSVSGGRIIVGAPKVDANAGIINSGRAFPFANTVSKVDSGCFGDPHIVTFGGDMYDFHGQCDLVLLSAPHFANGMGLDVNIRTKIVTGSWWSYIEAAAVRIGNDLLEVQGGFEDSWIWVNGEPNKKMEFGKAVTTHIGAYSIRAVQKGDKQRVVRIRRNKEEILVIKSYNEILRVDMFPSADFEESRGLLGSFPDGQKVARNGTTIMNDDIEFGKHWQVQANEGNLFHSVEGTVQAPDACVMPTMKTTYRRLGEGMRRREAEEACKNVRQKQWSIACVEDVLATGDKGVAEAYAEDDGAGAF